MRKSVVFLLFICSNLLTAQSINDYKYVLVPDKFEVTKKKIIPKLNVMAKMYMQKYGFESYLSTEAQPAEFSNTACNKLYLDLIEDNGIFITKLAVVLKDCRGTVLATSPMGKSKEKDLATAYAESLREAFDNFKLLQAHKYNGKTITEVQTMAVAKPAEVPSVKPVVSETVNPDMLYAQAIPNGFQLVNAEPKVIYKIYKTSNSDIYAAVKGNLSGVFIPKGNEWFFEYYQNDKLISEKVNVKF